MNLLTNTIAVFDFYEAMALALINSALMFFASFKFVQTLQQSGYDGRGYTSWLKRKDNIFMTRLVIVSILSVLSFLIFNIGAMIFIEEDWVIYLGFAFYLVFTCVYIKKDRSIKSKVPLIKTSRVNRLLLTFVLITFLLQILVLCLVNFAATFGDADALIIKLRYGVLCLSPMLLPLTVLIAYYVNEPFERYNKRLYIKRCKEKLSARPDLIKIGITGSYGKTSVKEILSVILSEKFNVLASPHSYNTPMGICKTVKRLEDGHEVLIAEMGARKMGDVKELVDIISPQYAILTGVIGQHIETFGSVTKIKNTKYELIEGLPEDGYAVFSVDNDASYELMQRCLIAKTGAGLDLSKSPTICAKDVSVTGEGTRFTLIINGQEIDCSTVLIGTHNVSNVCLAVAIAVKLGLTAEEIASGINKIKPIKHRLEIIQSQNGLTVIDDSFNANVNGTIAAMEVLDCFEGRKLVVTPGLVELGSVEESENYSFGARLAKHADEVILVGKRRVEWIKDGLISGDFPKEKIHTVKDLEEGKRLLSTLAREGDVIIFENDLPDKYN